MVEGAELRSGELRLSVLWPPRELAGAEDGLDDNTLSLVLLAEWRHFSMLLTGDAEAEGGAAGPGAGGRAQGRPPRQRRRGPRGRCSSAPPRGSR